MLFGLTNAVAILHSYIDNCLRPFIDDFTLCYVDNTLIYGINEKVHEEQIRKVVKLLREFGLHCNIGKCQLGVSEVGLLGFVIDSEGISIESDLISTIEDWPLPKSIRDLQILLGFTNFYRRFIRKYTKVAASIPDLLQTRSGSSRWQ
jgi:hypothetical protein